jgi:outer membrane biosynthesis protein TonB
MSASRVEDLWTRYLSDGTLPSDEEQELHRSLEEDDALRRRLLSDRQLDGLLDAVHAPDEDGRQFIRSFQDRLAVEGDDAQFVAQVEERIRRKPARRPAPPPSSSSLPLVLAAAGILAAILLSVFFLGSEPPSPVVKTREIPRIPEPAPAPPPIQPAPEKVVVDVRPKPEEPKPEVPKSPEPPPVVPDPAPPPAPAAPERRTVVEPPKPVERVVARLERVDGECRPDRAGDLTAGQGVETLGADSAAVVAYPDGTRLELGARTSAADFSDAKGKTLVLKKGTLSADVVKQPQGQPMTIRTSHAEVRVLGTTLKVTVDPGSTRLDVLSGKVRLIRLSDGKAVDVVSGYYAVAGPGIDLVSKSSAPKPKALLLQENFQDPRAVDGRWKIVGTASAVKLGAGQLDIDLNPRSSGPTGWGGGGLITRQSFAPPMAVSLDVDLPVLHSSVVAALVFIPQGQKRGGDGVFRIQLRENRYSLTVESGEARDLAVADRAAGSPCREKWRIEIEGASVRFLADGREILRHKHELQVPSGYTLEIDGSARADAPPGAKAVFDNVAVEPLK